MEDLDRRDDRELELIHRQMERTRASLGDKLEALESQVMDTVHTATEGVASAVEGVKATVETVSETVSTVTESLNFTKYVEKYPFGSVGCSMGAGFTAGLLFGGSNPPPPPPAPPPAPAPAQHVPMQAAATPPACPAPAPAGGESLMHKAAVGLTGLAVGAIGGVLRNLISSHLPTDAHGPLGGLVKQMMEGLGFEPPPEPAPTPPAAETRHDGDEARQAHDGPTQQTRQPRNGSRPQLARR